MFESLDEIRTFVCVVEAGSLSAASRSLRVSVNAVWRRVERIEERAGAPLIERTTRSLRPTEAGARLLLRARAILAELGVSLDDLTGFEREQARCEVPGVTGPRDAAAPTASALARVFERMAELPSRPGSCTAQTSMVAGSASCQVR